MLDSLTPAQRSLAESFRSAWDVPAPASHANSSLPEGHVQLSDSGALQSAEIVVRADHPTDWEVSFEMPGDLRMALHGHCAAFFEGEVKVAELRLESTGASSLSVPVEPGGARLQLRGCGDSARATLAFDDFQVKDRGIGLAELGWRVHHGRRRLNYLIDPALSDVGAGKMLVVFAAVGTELDFTYNYRNSLAKIDVHRVYILDDFGRQGSYYWMDHKDTDILVDVQTLLRELADELGVDIKDAVFAGSSKGGTAALIHGIALGAKEVVLGAPQYRLGDYLYRSARRILEFLTGGTDETARDWLNGQVVELLKRGDRRTRIRVLVGSEDHHLAAHVQPLSIEAKTAGYDVTVVQVPGLPHSALGSVYRHFITAAAIELQNGMEQDILPYSWIRRGRRAELLCWPACDEQIAVDLIGKNGQIERRRYGSDEKYLFQVPEGENYVRTRIFRKPKSGGEITAFSTPWA